jgi:hypothetical protein
VPVLFGVGSRVVLPAHSAEFESLTLVAKKEEDAVEEKGLVSLREAVAVGARLEVLVIKSGLAAGSLDMVAPLAQSLRRLSLERCPKVVGKLPSAPVIVAPRCMLSATVRLTKVPLFTTPLRRHRLSRGPGQPHGLQPQRVRQHFW